MDNYRLDNYIYKVIDFIIEMYINNGRNIIFIDWLVGGGLNLRKMNLVYNLEKEIERLKKQAKARTRIQRNFRATTKARIKLLEEKVSKLENENKNMKANYSKYYDQGYSDALKK